MILSIIDLVGTFFFAISGVLVALNKRLDPFGILIIAFVTAIGGGTLRDVIIGRTPVGWMYDLKYIYVIFLAVLIGVIFRKKLDTLRTSFLLFDTMGLSVFTMTGVGIGIHTGLHPMICIALGTMSACFGGVIRDILCNEIPVIFRKEIYATACILGGCIYFASMQVFTDEVSYIISIGVIVTVRLLAVRYKLKLPTFS